MELVEKNLSIMFPIRPSTSLQVIQILES